MNIEQKIVYQVGEETFPTYAQAEAALVDQFGEYIDGVFKGIDTGTMRYTEHSKMLIQLVEKLWADRSALRDLLSGHYIPNGEIEDLRSQAEYER